MWTGAEGEFVASAVKAGLLDFSDEFYVIHDYSEWAPDFVKRRWMRKNTVLTGHDRSNDGHDRPTQPNPTQPNPTQPNRSGRTESENLTVSQAKGSASRDGVGCANARNTGSENGVPYKGFETKFVDLTGKEFGFDRVRIETERKCLLRIAARISLLKNWKNVADQAVARAASKLNAEKSGKIKNAFGAWRKETEKEIDRAERES